MTPEPGSGSISASLCERGSFSILASSRRAAGPRPRREEHLQTDAHDVDRCRRVVLLADVDFGRGSVQALGEGLSPKEVLA